MNIFLLQSQMFVSLFFVKVSLNVSCPSLEDSFNLLFLALETTRQRNGKKLILWIYFAVLEYENNDVLKLFKIGYFQMKIDHEYFFSLRCSFCFSLMTASVKTRSRPRKSSQGSRCRGLSNVPVPRFRHNHDLHLWTSSSSGSLLFLPLLWSFFR